MRNYRISILFFLLLLPAIQADETFQRRWSFEPTEAVRGVFGYARLFPVEKPERIAMDFLPESGKLERFSVSAWIRPTKFDRYNEIFRQEAGEKRILFSLQENATILALGLNIGGYVECDAPIRRDELFDGNWHHVAGTFDGHAMRVYLDGREIFHLDRPGTIAVDRSVPGFIGSNGGAHELFVGTMDELRLSGSLLSAEDVAALYLEGQKSLEKQDEATAREVDKFYDKKDDFLETLFSACDATGDGYMEYAKTSNTDTASLHAALARRLTLDFPDECRKFLRLTNRQPVSIITSGSRKGIVDALRTEAERRMDLATEYLPITENQWARCTPEEKSRWENVLRHRVDFSETVFGETTDSLRKLLTVVEEVEKLYDERPRVREAVAPFVKPHTPEPRRFDENQAKESIRADWLFQCNGKPTAELVRKELKWTEKLLQRISSHPSFTPQQRQRRNTEMQNLADSVSVKLEKNPDDCREAYFDVREFKRKILFENPVLDFDRLVFVDRPYPAGSEWRHETRHRLGYMSTPGGQILLLDGLKPDGKVRRIMPRDGLHGTFWRFDLSYDAKKILLCYHPHNEKSFHIYEAELDGDGVRQITDGAFDDFDPVYLPDGENFVFTTTRGHTYVRCMPPTNAFVLARCPLGGGDVYVISQNNEPDYLPSVLDDGRLVYTRWEYTDKPLWRCQALWTANPDGTQHNALWGNQTVWPDLPKDVRQIPGSRRLMFTGSAHHDWFAGSVGIIDPDAGFNFPDGLTKVTADLPWPESGNGPVDPVESPDYHAAGNFRAYYSPYPISETDFLVSANRDGKFSLYLMDVDGNRELIYEGNHNILYAMPVRERARPQVLADRIEWPTAEEKDDPKPGTIYSGNVYFGAPEELKNKAKFLRVLNIEPKTYTLWDHRPYISTGPVVSMVQSEGVKRVLGTVPINEDGSVWFEAPSGVALHFQLLDENHRALQTMRSFTGLMPGENRGCLGCHESHSRSPESTGTPFPSALGKSPKRISPVPWAFDPKFEATEGSSIQEAIEQAARIGTVSETLRKDTARNGTAIGYENDVMPVFKRYCFSCHTGDGEGRKTFDMTPRPGLQVGGQRFDQTYVTLTGFPAWGKKYQTPQDPPPGFGYADMLHVEGFEQRDPAGYVTPKPLESLSYASRLIKHVSDGKHHGVRLDSVSLLRLILWVDAMCPYLDDKDIRKLPDPVFQGSEWLSVTPKLQSAPVIVRPGPFAAGK